MQLDNEGRKNWLKLARAENIGPRHFNTLITKYGNINRAIEAVADNNIYISNKKITLPSNEAIEEEIARTKKYGGQIIASCEKQYPQLLKQIYNFPPVITALGEVNILNTKALAIVGARNASANGCKFATKLSNELAECGYTIVSGMARGIDTYAHKASVDHTTVAVIAGGIDNIYPNENKGLYENIRDKGVIISEMPFNVSPKANSFPKRNRIISGLTLGTIVIEANLHSGSLITANFAIEQNRLVFSVPGSPLDPRSKGTNKLIKEGAKLVESTDDILEELELFSSVKHIEKKPINKSKCDDTNSCNTGITSKIIEKLTSNPVSIQDIISQTGLEAKTVIAILQELELSGKVDRHPGNMISHKYN